MSDLLTMEAVNALDKAGFVARLGGLFEHSPWVAEAAFAGAPFPDRETLHSAMAAAMWRAGREKQLALLNAHPELAGKEADAGTLTKDSTAEQDSVGLTRLSPEEKAEVKRLNAAYLAKHGFPFIIAVKLRSKRQILAAMQMRLDASTDAEMPLALMEVAKITRMRLEQLIPA